MINKTVYVFKSNVLLIRSLPHNDEKCHPQTIKHLVRPAADVSEHSLTLDEG